ncbi:pantothenate kinase 2 isoform X2 [Cryptomeria japonica]|uniref:pantothenate kinase 2 isoform X2 n=1 Tax=Cryptomeria japonica TaxID=3369 RepID=UPI0027DA787C|nr:pantothenate kinase 2 isoform X2 [Cryptomeria japonica]
MEESSTSAIPKVEVKAMEMHRSSSRPQLDVSGAAIQGNFEDRNPTILLPNQSDDISHFAIDLGGSLIKIVYFSRHAEVESELEDHNKRSPRTITRRRSPILGGRLHFVRFETSKLDDCLNFIQSKNLHRGQSFHERGISGFTDGEPIIKATGGGAYKFADIFKDRLGVTLSKEDEMDCLVAGANFLLKAIRHEAFTHMEGHKEFVQIDQNDLFPYLLCNIGSGVSMIKVDGDGKFQRVSGTNVGGGTFWGLGRLLTKCTSFDEILEISQGGDNRSVDMLVGDIYGGLDYSKIGLSASTIASSFGKVVSENKDLADYRREDIALSLLRMISYNIGQIAYLNALRYGLKRIFFGGFFIRGHAYTMDTISFAVQFWSKGAAQAMFLRHEGYMGALGAFMSYDKHGLSDWTANQFVERFPMGAPYSGGKIHGPPINDLNEKISWMEKFLQKGTEITAPVPITSPGTTGLGGFDRPSSREGLLRSDASANLNVGVLHLVPSLEPFPLLADPKRYEPNTVDLGDPSELQYWLTILSEHLPDLVDKAVASEGGTDNSKRRGDAFARAFRAHLARLMEEPAAYGKLGLANLLELREECLREFHFSDAYRAIKQRENEASLAVLQDLLMELDSMDEEKRLLALIEGVLAANIFDWGSRACVELYHKGTIIEIYRMSRKKMQRPWGVDDFDKFKERMLGSGKDKPKPHKRALLFVDNSGADIVLGMLPLTRELLRRGTEVVLVANSLPALNDVTASELPDIVAEAAKHCHILRKAAEAGGLLVDAMVDNQEEDPQNVSVVPPLMVVENGCGGPCIDFRQVSTELAAIAKDADLIILEGMGRSLHTNYDARFNCEALKLAMVKNQRLAEKILNGNIYDCICRYEPAV